MKTKRSNPIFLAVKTLNTLLVGLVISFNACALDVPADERVIDLPDLEQLHPGIFQLTDENNDPSAVANHLSIAGVDLAQQRVQVVNRSEQALEIPFLTVWSRTDENTFSGTVEPHGVVEIPLALAADADFVLMAVDEQAIRYLEYGGVFIDVPCRNDLWEGGALAAPANGGHIDATKPRHGPSPANANVFAVTLGSPVQSAETVSGVSLSATPHDARPVEDKKPHAWGAPTTHPVQCNTGTTGPVCGVNREQQPPLR
jgi:hypothetical protein